MKYILFLAFISTSVFAEDYRFRCITEGSNQIFQMTLEKTHYTAKLSFKGAVTGNYNVIPVSCSSSEEFCMDWQSRAFTDSRNVYMRVHLDGSQVNGQIKQKKFYCTPG